LFFSLQIINKDSPFKQIRRESTEILSLFLQGARLDKLEGEEEEEAEDED
jgi:hypothetical protein